MFAKQLVQLCKDVYDFVFASGSKIVGGKYMAKVGPTNETVVLVSFWAERDDFLRVF